MKTSSVRPFKTAEGPLHGSVLSPCEDSVLRGWDPKVPVGSPVSLPKRSNPAWRLVAPSSPCRINTKSKHQRHPDDAEFLRLLFYHAHRESEEFFRLTGQLAQPNQDYVFSKRAAFFNGLKSKVGHIMAKATALRVNLNLAPSIPSTPRPPKRKSHAHLLYALNLSHHVLFPHGA